MKFGVAIFPTEAVQPPGDIARMAEDRGFGCLLFPEHTHIRDGGLIRAGAQVASADCCGPSSR